MIQGQSNLLLWQLISASVVLFFRDADLPTAAVLEKYLCVPTVSQVSKNKKPGTREPS